VEEVEVQEDLQHQKLDYLEDQVEEAVEMEEQQVLEILRQLVHLKEIMEEQVILHSHLQEEGVEQEE
jgi:hypothetical protein